MAKGVLIDYAGLADATLKVVGSSENAAVQTAEGVDGRGDYAARETFNPLSAPTNSYELCGDVNAATKLILGTVVAGTGVGYVLTGFTVGTGAATVPTITATCASVTTGDAADYTFTLPAQTISAKHINQILFSAFTMEGAGCNVIACNASITSNFTRSKDEDGVSCAWGQSAAKLEVTATIRQYEAVAPAITPGGTFIVTGALTPTESAEDYEEYTVTLTDTPTSVAPGA